MRDVITFTVPLPPRGLRVRSRTQHTGYRAKLVREYQEQVWIAGDGGIADYAFDRADEDETMPWEYARLTLAWHHVGVAPDADNALASCKALIDVLHTRSKRPLGIVFDDSPTHLRIERVALVKAAHRHEERVEVRVERLTANEMGTQEHPA